MHGATRRDAAKPTETPVSRTLAPLYYMLLLRQFCEWLRAESHVFVLPIMASLLWGSSLQRLPLNQTSTTSLLREYTGCAATPLQGEGVKR